MTVIKKYWREVENEAEERQRNCPQMWNLGKLLQPISIDDYKYFAVGNIYNIIFMMLIV